MAPASQLGWGRGWPNCVTDEIVTARVGGRGLRLPVRRQIVPLVAGLVADLETARGDAFTPEWSWGFACRAIANTRTPSNHSQGVAVDLDAPENPYLSAATHRLAHPLRHAYPGGRILRSTMPYEAEAIARRWGFRWGGTYSTKPDPMHFEIAVTPAGAAALIADLRELDGRPVAAHPWPWKADDMYAPTDVMAIIPADELAIDDDGHLLMRADGTIEHHGTKQEVGRCGDYTKLKPEWQIGGPRIFLPDGLWLGDKRRRRGLGVYYSQLATDGGIYQFGPASIPLLRG